MGIIDKFKNIRKNKAPMTSGAKKAAEGRSDLADAATKLKEMRGDNVSIGGDAATPPDGDKMSKLVDGAKTIRTMSATGEDKVLGGE